MAHYSLDVHFSTTFMIGHLLLGPKAQNPDRCALNASKMHMVGERMAQRTTTGNATSSMAGLPLREAALPWEELEWQLGVTGSLPSCTHEPRVEGRGALVFAALRSLDQQLPRQPQRRQQQDKPSESPQATTRAPCPGTTAPSLAQSQRIGAKRGGHGRLHGSPAPSPGGPPSTNSYDPARRRGLPLEVAAWGSPSQASSTRAFEQTLQVHAANGFPSCRRLRCGTSLQPCLPAPGLALASRSATAWLRRCHPPPAAPSAPPPRPLCCTEAQQSSRRLCCRREHGDWWRACRRPAPPSRPRPGSCWPWRSRRAGRQAGQTRQLRRCLRLRQHAVPSSMLSSDVPASSTGLARGQP